MADEATPEAPETQATAERVRAPLWRRIARWAAMAIGGLVVLLGALLLGLNTEIGRRFVASTVSGYSTGSGLNFRVGRIEGSLYGAMVLRDVRVRDPKGVFASAQTIRVDWRPFAFLNNHIDVRALTSPRVLLQRLPELKKVPSNPDAPLLPDIDIDIGRLSIARLEIGAAVTGQRHIARIQGQAHIADGRAQVIADAATVAAPGVAGGDRLAVRLDAVPQADKLDLDLKLAAPKNGLVAGLAGLQAPLAFSVDGDGSWKAWNGKAVGRLGGKPLADLAIRARNGNFRVQGQTQPGLMLDGAPARLTTPRLDVAIEAALAKRTVDTHVRLKSAAMAVTADGLVDLGRNRFRDFRLTAQLLQPGSIAPRLVGSGVHAAVALNGPFARPVVDYKLDAARLGFGETRVEQLYAEGQARVDARRILVPVHAVAKRVAGLNAAAGGLVTNLRLDGDFAISGDQILSDNLKLRSDRIDATAVIAADMGDGRYTGALKGRVNDYAIDGVGIVNLSTHASLYAAPGGGFGIRGQIAGRTARIFNDGAREFLGGNAVASVRLGLDPAGVITFSSLRLNAPRFRITNGSGRYDPKGALLVDADAYSARYGPISARVRGSMAKPELLLRAPRPGLGIGLAQLEAHVRGDGGNYAVLASGDTSYGPFNADVLLNTAKPMTIDIRSGRFAGMDIKGRVQATAAGPFDGRLEFAGSGVTGTALLGNADGVQRADIDAHAYQASIPGTAGLTIGRALISARAILYPDKPAITADVQIAGLRQGRFVLRAARAKLAYQGGQGSAQLYAEGSTGVPFQLAANARLSPERYLVALKGEASGVKFHTDQAAQIVKDEQGYRLLPAEVDFDRGVIRLAGRYGDGTSLQARLDKLDLAVVNAFMPGLGIGGTASGAVDFAQTSPESFPQAMARLDISDFTRATLADVSTAVDIALVGKLLPDGGDARALIRRGKTTIGRVVATLRPLGPEAGPWTERLMAAPLSGGLRYNGPSAVLFSLTGLENQQLSGPVGLAADFTGHVRAPQLAGVVRGSKLVYENQTYGTRLTDLQIQGQFDADRLVLQKVEAKAGDGTVSAQGSIGLAADAGFPVDVTATLKDARLARSDALGATATGTLHVTHGLDGGRIEGQLRIPEARYQVVRQGSADVPELTGVRRVGDQREDSAEQQRAEQMSRFELRIRVSADNRLFVNGMGLESEWRARFNIGGTTANPRVTGNAEAVRGTYSFGGRRFDITRGTIEFSGNALDNPTIDISASTTAEGVTAILNVTGTAQKPQISFTSNPALPQDEVVSRLLFGSSVTNLSATEALQLAAALNSLRGSGGGLNPLGKLRAATGIDRLRLLSSDQASGRSTALAAGKYITDDIYVEIITDARGFTATQLEIALTRTLSVLSQAGSFGGSSVSLRYSRDY